MPEYMLSVNHVEGEPMPSGEDMQRAFDDVDASTTELRTPARGSSPVA